MKRNPVTTLIATYLRQTDDMMVNWGYTKEEREKVSNILEVAYMKIDALLNK